MTGRLKKLRPYDEPPRRRRRLIPGAPDSAAGMWFGVAALWLVIATGIGLLWIAPQDPARGPAEHVPRWRQPVLRGPDRELDVRADAGQRRVGLHDRARLGLAHERGHRGHLVRHPPPHRRPASERHVRQPRAARLERVDRRRPRRRLHHRARRAGHADRRSVVDRWPGGAGAARRERRLLAQRPAQPAHRLRQPPVLRAGAAHHPRPVRPPGAARAAVHQPRRHRPRPHRCRLRAARRRLLGDRRHGGHALLRRAARHRQPALLVRPGAPGRGAVAGARRRVGAGRARRPIGAVRDHHPRQRRHHAPRRPRLRGRSRTCTSPSAAAGRSCSGRGASRWRS